MSRQTADALPDPAALEAAVIEALACARGGEVATVPVADLPAGAATRAVLGPLASRLGLVLVDTATLVSGEPNAFAGLLRSIRGQPVLLVASVAAPDSSVTIRRVSVLAAAVTREAPVVVLVRAGGVGSLASRRPPDRASWAVSPYARAALPIPRVAEGGPRASSNALARDAAGETGAAATLEAHPEEPCVDEALPEAVWRARRLGARGRRAAADVALRAAMSRLVQPLDEHGRLACRIELARNQLALGRLDAARRALGTAADLRHAEVSPGLAWQSAVVDALVRVERRDFTRAIEQLSTAFDGAGGRWPAVAVEAGLGLVRAFFWAGRADASERWALRLARELPLSRTAVVELAWRRARVARRAGDVTSAARLLGGVPPADEQAAVARAQAGLLVERTALTLMAGEGLRDGGHLEQARSLVRQAGDIVRRRVEADWLDVVVDHAPVETARAVVEEWRLPGRVATLAFRARPGTTPLLEWRRRAALARLAARRTSSAAASTAGTKEARPRMIHEIAELIALVQGHESREVPRAVCEWLRAHLSAASVAFVDVGDTAGPSRFAGAGGPVWPAASTVKGAAESRGIAVWSDVDGASEVALPMADGGRVAVALAARWPAGTTLERERVGAVLDAAAAIARAAAYAAVDDRRRPPPPAVDAFGLVGVSQAMSVVREAVRRAGLAPFPVLVEGESGSGKELIARAIHASGPRRHRRFCAVNCAAMNDDLVEGELFGHARGAFTGAVQERAGLFEEADGGTLFLDEVGELSARAQAKLLRALQEGEVRRVGENVPRRVDARIVAATNRALADEVARGAFRADLRYRLDVLHIHVPPLRERRDDIPLIAAHLWRGLAARAGTEAALSPGLVEALSRYDWPGNVRELQNVLATLAVHAPRRGRLDASMLPRLLGITTLLPPPATLDEARRRFEVQFVRETLARCGGRRTDAARALGLSRQGLAKTLARLGLTLGEMAPDRGR